jgi:carbon monoxide dehydrogenase subunit G
MKITNKFTVHTPIDRAWQVLTDLEGIAPCMPGARLTGVEGDVYQGKVKVKVGPVISEFAGTARFTEKDDAGYRAVIDAKGRDARSAGNAAALVTAVLTPAGDSTSVSVDTDLKISGKLAQFGSGMIKEVSGKLLAQFVTNLEAKLAADETTPAIASTGAETEKTAASSTVAQTAVEDAAPPAPAFPVPAQASPVSSAPAKPAAEAPTPAPAAGPAPVESPAVESAAVESPAVESAAVESPAVESAAVESPAVESPAVRSPAPARSFADTAEPEPLDLLSVAGGSIYKRLIPVAAGVVVVGAVIAWLIARR